MCEYCDKAKTNICGQDMITSLGDDVGVIHINTYLITKLESTEGISPALYVDAIYKDKHVFGLQKLIHYCPFCGRKLRES